MKLTKIFFMLLIISSIYLLAYAGGLISQEAVNYYNEGLEAEKKGNFALADTSYTKAMLVAPTDENYRKFIINNIGARCARHGDFVNAEKAFKDALKIDPNYEIAQLNLGLIYDRQADELKAIKHWLKLFKIDLNEKKPQSFILEDKQRK